MWGERTLSSWGVEFKKQDSGVGVDLHLLFTYFCVASVFSSKHVLFDILKIHKEKLKLKRSNLEKASQAVSRRYLCRCLGERDGSRSKVMVHGQG